MMEPVRDLYLNLLKNCLTRYTFDRHPRYRELQRTGSRWQRLLYPRLRKALAARNLVLARPIPYDPVARAEGHEWPPPIEAETMIGLKGLNNLQYCISDVLQRGVPGDFIETGAWRGGAAVFMRAMLQAHEDTMRSVWVADSFQGLPEPEAFRSRGNADDTTGSAHEMIVGLNEVKASFERYGLLDEQVRFLVGWFHETLPSAPIEALAILRLDGGLYESTMDGLQHLYHKLSVGGYTIINDSHGTRDCIIAVDEFRAARNITEDMHRVNGEAVFWQKQR